MGVFDDDYGTYIPLLNFESLNVTKNNWHHLAFVVKRTKNLIPGKKRHKIDAYLDGTHHSIEVEVNALETIHYIGNSKSGINFISLINFIKKRNHLDAWQI